MGRLPQTKKPKRGDKLAEHIGQQLLKARTKKLWTQRDVAEHTGLSASYVCQVEGGWSTPTAETLWKMSTAFDLPPSYWFKGYA